MLLNVNIQSHILIVGCKKFVLINKHILMSSSILRTKPGLAEV